MPTKPAASLQPPAIEKRIEAPYAATAMKPSQRADRSADSCTLTRRIIRRSKQEQNAELLKSHKSRANLIAELLNNADVPARVVRTPSTLEDGRRRQSLDYLQVFNSRPTHYRCLVSKAVNRGQPATCCGNTTPAPLLDVTGGHNSRVTFSMIEQEQQVNVALAPKFQKPE